MKIYIENEILEYENKTDEIDNILDEIDEVITKASKTLSHMVIDNFEVFESYYDYFLDNIKVIKKVEIVSLTYKELIDDILISKIDYLENTPNKIGELANTFYKVPDKESWENLNDLLGAIGWIINTFSSIDQDPRLKDSVSSYEDWNLYAGEVFSLQEILGEFEGALSNNDSILIGDILSYEILPKFEEMAERLSKLVSREDNLNDLN